MDYGSYSKLDAFLSIDVQKSLRSTIEVCSRGWILQRPVLKDLKTLLFLQGGMQVAARDLNLLAPVDDQTRDGSWSSRITTIRTIVSRTDGVARQAFSPRTNPLASTIFTGPDLIGSVSSRCAAIMVPKGNEDRVFPPRGPRASRLDDNGPRKA